MSVVTMQYRGGTLRGDEEHLRRIVAEMEAERERRARWPENGSEAMTVLGEMFPSMRGVPGVKPWNAMALVDWLNSGAPTSGSWHAAMFLLHVWNIDTDWRKEGLKARAGYGRFNLGRAMASWDDAHRRACLAWVEAPFFP